MCTGKCEKRHPGAQEEGDCCDDKPCERPASPKMPFAIEQPGRPLTLEEAAHWWTRFIRRYRHGRGR